MKTTTLFKTLAVFVTFALSMTSCQSEMDEPQSPIPFEDMPIKSLSDSRSDVSSVANGECVMVQYNTVDGNWVRQFPVRALSHTLAIKLSEVNPVLS